MSSAHAATRRTGGVGAQRQDGEPGDGDRGERRPRRSRAAAMPARPTRAARSSSFFVHDQPRRPEMPVERLYARSCGSMPTRKAMRKPAAAIERALEIVVVPGCRGLGPDVASAVRGRARTREAGATGVGPREPPMTASTDGGRGPETVTRKSTAGPISRMALLAHHGHQRTREAEGDCATARP